MDVGMNEFGFFCRDCMDGMKEYPDKFFDLAITDPPYGINLGHPVKSNISIVGGRQTVWRKA